MNCGVNQKQLMLLCYKICPLSCAYWMRYKLRRNIVSDSRMLLEDELFYLKDLDINLLFNCVRTLQCDYQLTINNSDLVQVIL